MWNGKSGVFKAHASVNIYGAGLVPQEVTAALGVEPTQARVKDGYGSWGYSSRDRVDNLAPLEEHIRHLLGVFEPRVDALLCIRARFAARAFCYFASQSDLGGFKIGSEILSRLGALGLDLDVDEYFCCGD